MHLFNKIMAVALLITGGHSAFSQETNWCATDEHMEQSFLENPALKAQMHEHLLRITSGEMASGDRDEECIVPVVVHILHDNGEGNISYEQVVSGIDMLNEDFNRDNADADDTRDTEGAPFLAIASDMGIRFELAKIDPDGNCTNGIQRRNVGSRSYNTNDNAKHYGTGGLDQWNRNFYFNIWIVNSISSGSGGTTLGYAEFPYSGGSSNFGVIIRNDAYGTTGTASGDRTLTHEVGHCFGLLHTFQGGCHSSSCDAAGDYCCDTPPVSEAQWSCIGTQNTCDDIPSGDFYDFDALDQFENFMSYSPCQNMYSEDQKNIVLSNLESIGFLANLVDPDNYDLTGIGYPEVLCKAQFNSTMPTVCAGGEVTYFDDSYANVTGWTWTFEGGTPATSTLANPVVTYDTPGNYTVTLEVTDGAATESIVSTNYVNVLANPGMNLPFSEGFETLAAFPDNERFMVVNEDEENPWEIIDGTAYTGNKSIYIANRGNNNGTIDEFISGTIDLSEVDPDEDIVFNFKYAYKRRYTSNDEWLRFYISNDCGETWALRKNIHGDDLSEATQGSAYFPTSQDEWTQVDITNINSTYYTANFRFKIQFENDNGNNIFIDDINMYNESMASTSELESNNSGLSIYPNPVVNSVNINFNSDNNANVNMVLLNALGQQIDVIYNGEVNAGENTIQYATESLPAGIYFIRTINAEGLAETKKFIKKVN